MKMATHTQIWMPKTAETMWCKDTNALGPSNTCMETQSLEGQKILHDDTKQGLKRKNRDLKTS
jgi:hypothetical protein